MGIDLYVMFGDTKVDDVDSDDYDGRCYIREGYGGGPYVTRLMFPDAFNEDDTTTTYGAPFEAEALILLFLEKGIDILKERYRENHTHVYFNALQHWLDVLKLIQTQEKELKVKCRVWASW